MNGAQHYRRAETLVDLALRQREQEAPDDLAPLSALTMAQAQVYATLATVPEDTMRMWESLREHMLDRIEEDRSVDTFRRVWAEADARGEHGQRVRQALAAVVREVLL